MSETTYNGWTNYETWVVNLWMTNDGSEWADELAVQCLGDADGDEDSAVYALAQALEEQHDEFMPETTGVYADLLGHALGMVEWREIAQHCVNDVIDQWREDNREESETDSEGDAE